MSAVNPNAGKLASRAGTPSYPVAKTPAGAPYNPVKSKVDTTDRGAPYNVNPKVKQTKPLSQLPIKEQQKRLVSLGYNVTVDGIEGPQTQMARKAFLNGVSPNYWNKVWLKNHGGTSAGSSSGGAPPASSGSTGTGSGSGSTGSTQTTTTKPEKTTPTDQTSVPDAPQLDLIDPQAYANAAANAEFAPQLAGANFNLNYARKALPETLKDLTGWNQQVTNTFNNYDGAAAFNQPIQDAQAAAANVAQLFGGSTAADAQAANSPNVAMLQGLQGNQKGFQDIMQSVLAAQGRDYARRATREGNVDIAKAQSELSGLRAQKGAARSKYLADATSTRTSQQQAQAALDQAAALAPAQIAEANANATIAKINAKNAPEIARINLRKAQLETKAAIATAKANADKASGKINWNDPAVVDSVSNGAVTGAIGPKGGMVLRPDLALQNILVTAQGAGAPPNVVAAAISKLVRSLNISHGKGQWTAWKWNGKSFVLDKAKAKANAKKK